MQIVPHGNRICATQNQTKPLFVSGRPKPVAYYDPRTKTLQKNIDFSKHLVLTPRAIAFDANVLAQAEKLGTQHIRVVDITTNDIWTISFADFQRYQFSVNRGYGAQFAVELGRWNRNGQPSELAQREQLQANKASQLSMFDTPTDSTGYMEVYR